MSQKMQYQGYYTAAEAKRILGITDGMLYNYVRNGDLTRFIPPGRKQGVYRKSEVDQLAQELQTFMAVRRKTASTFSRATTEDIKASTEITRLLFGLRDSEEATTVQRIRWIEKNPDIFYVVKAEDQVVGYALMLPLKLEKIEQILNGEAYAQEVTADEIETFEPGKLVHIYLTAIGVRPGLTLSEKRTYGARLISGMFKVFIDLGRRGIVIKTLAARSDTPDGIRFLRHSAFTEISSVTHTRNFIIKVRESGIPIIQEYKRALLESGYGTKSSARVAIEP